MLALDDYLASRSGALPTFAGGRIAFAPDAAPASPTSPLAWRLMGRDWHEGDPNVYRYATNAIYDQAHGVYYDVTGFGGTEAAPTPYRAVADLAAGEGCMNIVWRCSPGDLNAAFGDVAFAYATMWGGPKLIFNGLQCPARPSGDGVRYPVFASGIRESVWTRMPIWWPNNQATASPSCAVDPGGTRTAWGALWHGDVAMPLTIVGATLTIRLPVIIGQSYWFDLPTPHECEILTFAYGLGLIDYSYWFDGALGDGQTPVVGAAADLLDVNGVNVSLPAIPTGTGGKWQLGIRSRFDDIEPVSGMPAGWNAAQFLSSVPGFPGQAP